MDYITLSIVYLIGCLCSLFIGMIYNSKEKYTSMTKFFQENLEGEKVFHIYSGKECLAHNLSKEEFESKMEEYKEVRDITYEQVGGYTPSLYNEPSGEHSY